MKKISTCLLTIALGALAIAPAYSQKPASGSTKSERVIKEVNGCNYEVISGLAEVTSIERVVVAAKSPLQYDEYEVKFRFIPKEGGELMSTLRDVEIPFMLKYKQHQLRVGPEFIKAYQLRVGLKYAMKILQNRNGECNEKFIYESGGMPNDLFEARPRLADFEQDIYEKKLGAVEEGIAEEDFNNTTNPNNIPDNTNNNPTKTEPIKPTTDNNTKTNPVVQPPTNNTTTTEPNKTTTQPTTDNNPSTTDNSSNSNLDEEALKAKLQKELEEQIRKELEAEKLRKQQEEEARKKALEEENRKNAAKQAKEQAKLDELKRKEEEERKRVEEEQRKAKEEALKAQLRSELEAKLREEMRQKEEAEAIKKAEEERKRLEDERLKQEALAREEAQRKAREAEAQRSSCAYTDKVSGVIEIVETRKSKEANESVFGYAEYEVTVRFTPDNFDDIPKKDRKVWEDSHVFVLDAKGKSANPSARYIRQFNVFKGAKYKGFAQVLQSGICNQLMIFSPDLPADVSQVKP